MFNVQYHLMYFSDSDSDEGRHRSSSQHHKHKKDKKKHKHKHKHDHHKHRSDSENRNHSSTDRERHSKHRHKHKHHRKHKRDREDDTAVVVPELSPDIIQIEEHIITEVSEIDVSEIELPVARKAPPRLDPSSVLALEEARAILEAKLASQEGISAETIEEKVVNAMSLIAEDYQSESEEEGELIDRQARLRAIIDDKVNEISSTIPEESMSGSELGEIIEISDVEMELEKAVDLIYKPSRRKKFRGESPSRREPPQPYHKSPPPHTHRDPYSQRDQYQHADRDRTFVEKENRSPPRRRSRTRSPPRHKPRLNDEPRSRQQDEPRSRREDPRRLHEETRPRSRHTSPSRIDQDRDWDRNRDR